MYVCGVYIPTWSCLSYHTILAMSMQPLEKCLMCGLEYPLDELPDHIDECENA